MGLPISHHLGRQMPYCIGGYGCLCLGSYAESFSHFV